MTYEKQHDGEWVRPVKNGFKIACCDCGLVHVMDFRIVDGHVEYRVKRDNRATGQIRRYAGIKLNKTYSEEE